MDFLLSEDQRDLLAGLEKMLEPFGDDYWLSHDQSGEFPEDFYRVMAEGGWLGIATPEEMGGGGLGVVEAALMMEAVAKKGGMTAASAIHVNIFGPCSLMKHASEEQQRRWLPPLLSGDQKMCFGVTEANVGLDTTRLKTRAVRDGNRYVINGGKCWTTTAQVADKIMLLARTDERDDGNPAGGLSLFFTDLDPSAVEVKRIEKMGRHAVDTNLVFINDLEVPPEDLVGEVGMGFRYLLQSLNPERILVAIEAVGIAASALERAVEYAKEREVFERPIGMNQSIQHPLAEGWARLEAARLLCLKAAALSDAGEPCGVEANAAKYLAAETGIEVCKQAVATHGGMGYAREYHVERLFREMMIPYLVPVSQQLALCHVAEKGLGLPKSY
ncbi:MAG: acyl-CoA dehydrogenase family protein [Pseudomonadota bacterium]